MLSTLCSEIGFLTGLEFTDSVSLAVQQTLGVFLSPSSTRNTNIWLVPHAFKADTLSPELSPNPCPPLFCLIKSTTKCDESLGKFVGSHQPHSKRAVWGWMWRADESSCLHFCSMSVWTAGNWEISKRCEDPEEEMDSPSTLADTGSHPHSLLRIDYNHC